MSRYKVSLRLVGELDPLEDYIDLLGGVSVKVTRRGSINPLGHVQSTDVLGLELAAWQSPSFVDADQADQNQAFVERDHLLPAVLKLQRLAAGLSGVDRARCRVELYISTIREEEQGGFSLPAALLTAAAACGLSLEVSILVMLDDQDDEDANDAT